MEKTYLCIDLKSFYASVECAERGLDAMTTNLVVADPERSVNTLCLAITPAMKNSVSRTAAVSVKSPFHTIHYRPTQNAEIY